MSKVKFCQKRFVNTNEKFGIEVPWNVKHARELDKRSGNKLWADAITKEMKNVWITFDIPNETRIPNNHQHMHCHMIFNIKMESFCHKARLVAGGNSTEASKCMM